MIYEIVQEYIRNIEGINVPIKGRIKKSNLTPTEYIWETNFRRIDENIVTASISSPQKYDSLDSAQKQLFEYLKSFKSIGVPNPFY